MDLMIAAIQVGGDGLVNQLLTFLLLGICVGLIYAVGWWFIRKFALPPVVLTIWQGLFILVGLVVILNFLLGMAGKPFIKW